METANLLLNAAVLGASTSKGVSSSQATDSGSGEGSDFQELVAKLLDECGIGAKADEVKAGQQSPEHESDSKTEDGQGFAEGIAQAECLLGSIGVILGTTEPASVEIANTSSPVQLERAPISETTRAMQESASVVVDGTMPVEADRSESSVQAAQVGPLVVKNEVLGAVSEAQPNAFTQGTASRTIVQDNYQQPEPTEISVKPTDLSETTSLAEKTELPARQVKTDGEKAFIDSKTAPQNEESAAETAHQAVGPVLSDGSKAAPKLEALSAAQTQNTVKNSEAEASSLESSPRASGKLSREATEVAQPGLTDQTTGAVKSSQVTGMDNPSEFDPGDLLQLPPVEETGNEKDVNNGKPEHSGGVVPSSVIDTPGFKATEAVQKSQGNLPPEQVVSAKVIHQIVKAAKVNITEGRSDIALRLDPPHLGTVQMNVTVTEGTVTASLQTSTESAKQVLQSDLATLKQSLSDAGINVDKIEVSVGGNLDQGQGWNLNSSSHEWSAGGRANAGSLYGNMPQDTEFISDMAGTASQTSSGRLDFLA